MVPADSRKVSPASRYSGYHYAHSGFTYGAITRCGRPFQNRSIRLHDTTLWSYNPGRAVTRPVWAVPRSLATTWGITIVFFSYPYLDVSVRGVRLPRLLGGSMRLSYSEIHGSTLFCSSPWLIAALHVLHRLCMPRHPPCALSNFAYMRRGYLCSSLVPHAHAYWCRCIPLSFYCRSTSARRSALFVFITSVNQRSHLVSTGESNPEPHPPCVPVSYRVVTFFYPCCGARRSQTDERTLNALEADRVELDGVEPTTSCLQGRRSSQLSYSPIFD